MYESRERVPVQTVLDNYDTVEHTVTVQAVVDDFVVGEETQTVHPGDDQPVIIYLAPEDVHEDLELYAIPDGSADAVADGYIEPSNAAPIPSEVPATTAVTLFAIVNGVGGAASQLYASSALADVESVAMSKVAIAGGLAIAGALFGSRHLAR